MNTIDNKTDNRDKIIEISINFFYEYGYNQTSFKLIADYCGITKGLITYHFGTKANLAKIIVEKYSKEIKNRIDEKIYKTIDEGYDIFYGAVAQIIIINQMYRDDPEALHFFIEYLDSGFNNQFLDGYVHFYKIINRHHHLITNKYSDELTMWSTTSMFSCYSLFYAYFTNKLNCSYEEFMDYYLQLPFTLAKVEDKKIDDIIEKGKKIVNQLDYKIAPYFKVI